ncbi:MAG: pyrroloquinoline quinone biosynthesis protein B [Patescibacteria group bacterium]|jgi:pyrroloquinoline quinone biosynthesis protein B
MLRLLVLLLLLSSCKADEKNPQTPRPDSPYLIVLGTAQDAGYPQADCKKKCCEAVWSGAQKRKKVSCIGLVDPQNNQHWIFDASPDFKDQLNTIQQHTFGLAGVFLTHAHIGHYTGLIHLGREAMGAKNVPVYAMPRMQSFLTNNGPWSQLVSLNNIDLHGLKPDSIIQLSPSIQVVPFSVPHRDEFSETVGFEIRVNEKSAIFIPDIDKWEKWDRSILDLIKEVDVAFLDGTFYENGELPGRDMSEIPHPFVEESMALFSELSTEEKEKIRFIHFNHTNDLLRKGSAAQQEVIAKGFGFAVEGDVIEL